MGLIENQSPFIQVITWCNTGNLPLPEPMTMTHMALPVASFIKEVNRRLAKHPLKTNGQLANRKLTSLVKEATCDWLWADK